MEIKGTLTITGGDRFKADPRVLRLQRELKALSKELGMPELDPGKLDGKLGDENSATRRALSNFAKWRNRSKPSPEWGRKPVTFPEDGTLDEPLAAYLNAQFDVTAVGKIVQDRDDSLKLKERRIREIRKGLEEAKTNARHIELRERLHKWLERKAAELENDEFHGLEGYEQVAFVFPPEDEILVASVEGIGEECAALLGDYMRGEGAQPILYVSDLVGVAPGTLAETLCIELERANGMLAAARALLASGPPAQGKRA